jgi:hypothetical protein
VDQREAMVAVQIARQTVRNTLPLAVGEGLALHQARHPAEEAEEVIFPGAMEAEIRWDSGRLLKALDRGEGLSTDDCVDLKLARRLQGPFPPGARLRSPVGHALVGDQK